MRFIDLPEPRSNERSGVDPGMALSLHIRRLWPRRHSPRLLGEMAGMTTLHILVVLGLGAAVCSPQSSDGQTNSTAKPFPASWVDDRTEVTCKAAYYRRFKDDVLFPVEEARRVEKLMVSGVVLTVITPREFAGQVIAFHFDYGPEPWDHWYKPDVIYAGSIPKSLIGRLAFMCDPGWHAATNPPPTAPNESLHSMPR